MKPSAPIRSLCILLSLAATTFMAVGGCNSPDQERVLAGSDREKSNSNTFTDVTPETGLSTFRHVTGAFGKKWIPETTGSGCAFLDYNNDGWSDILLVGGGAWPGTDVTAPQVLWLYRNNGDGTFADVTEESGLADLSAYGFGITAADYDNDGDQDFFLTALHENKLFRNDAGVFTEVGIKAGVAGPDKWSTAAAFFDADRDGWLDLYVGNYIDWSPEKDRWCTLDGNNKEYCTPELYEGVPGQFFHNNGDGTFTDWSEKVGVHSAPGSTLGVVSLDFNKDGWPDLAVANDLQRNLLYVNDGTGTFTEEGLRSGIAFGENGKARAGMGIDVGHVDSTGDVSIFVGNFSGEMIGVYRHLENGLFLDRSAVSKIGHPSLRILTFGLFLFDVDLDGDLDLFAANGHVQPDVRHVQNGIPYRQPTQLFMNAGNGTFEAATPKAESVLAKPLVARGAAYADYDRDGDLDVLITENGGPSHLWRNDGPTGNFLRVHLRGRRSNRDGIGARVTAWAGGNRLERRTRSGSSYLSQSEKVVTFGLGPETKVDSLRILWPNGKTDRIEQVTADQEIRIVEGTDAVALLSTEPALATDDDKGSPEDLLMSTGKWRRVLK